MLSDGVRKELDRTRKLGEQLQGIVVNKKYSDGERDTLLLAYWDLVSEFHRGIHLLVQQEMTGSAFALVRPVVEALVRAHVALMGSDDDVKSLRDDSYKTNFKTVGPSIDAAFGLPGMMENFLNERARNALHSYTHAGLMQLGKRFQGGYIKPNYSDGAVLEVLRVTTVALLMLTSLLTKHFGFEDDWKKVQDLSGTWDQT